MTDATRLGHATRLVTGARDHTAVDKQRAPVQPGKLCKL
eukprot:COSAG06_NODE_63935_length_261_cov_0.567901_2_plen_38_part_01